MSNSLQAHAQRPEQQCWCVASLFLSGCPNFVLPKLPLGTLGTGLVKLQ